MEIKTISKRMYEYSKDTQKEIVSKKTNIHKNKNTQKPVTNTTSIKYCSINNSPVNSKVLCTRCRSTQTVEYTWQLSKNVTERGDIGVLAVKAVCKKNAPNIMANVRKYSTSDITEMAENNGQMDVDPEGLRMYGPYGKLIVNLYTIVIHVCKNLMRCSNPNTAVCKYGGYRDVKVHVRNKMYSHVIMDASSICVYCEERM